MQQYIAESIHSFPYQVQRNEKNLGSNDTFEKLTQQARGKYIAYCDQDDVWLPEKLEILQRTIEQTSAKLVCSDMYIIDGQGRQTADSITKVRRHHVFLSGNGLADGLLFRNFVTGCTMMMPAALAKQAAPFCPYMVHDHYLALCAADQGHIVSLKQPLICYRIHGNNQTGIMTGVRDKESYARMRIDSLAQRLQWLDEHFQCSSASRLQIQKGKKWAHARQENWRYGKSKAEVWKYRELGKPISFFELVAPYMPKCLFRLAIKLAKKNIL